MTLATCLAHGTYLMRALGRQTGNDTSQSDTGLSLSTFRLPTTDGMEKLQQGFVTVVRNPLCGLKRLFSA